MAYVLPPPPAYHRLESGGIVSLVFLLIVNLNRFLNITNTTTSLLTANSPFLDFAEVVRHLSVRKRLSVKVFGVTANVW